MYKKLVISSKNSVRSTLDNGPISGSQRSPMAVSWKAAWFSASKNFIFSLAFLLTVGALMLNHQVQALSLISEKCDPNKVGPDETTVKGGWQAEMFNGLSFRACGK